MKYENIVQCQFSARKSREMHFHQDIEIIYVLEGTLELGFEDGKQFLDTDDFYLVNSNVRHEYQTDSRVLLGSLFIDYTMLTEIFGGEHIFSCAILQRSGLRVMKKCVIISGRSSTITRPRKVRG